MASPAPAHDNPAADGYLASLEICSTADEPITDWPEPRFAQF
jgi:hypothetical protein